MSLGSPTVPSPPTSPLSQFGIGLLDPFSLATQQQAYNTSAGLENQAASMPAMSTPGYTQSWGEIGTGPNGVPLYGINQQLDPQAQTNFDQYQANQYMAGALPSQFFIPTGEANLNSAGNYFAQANDFLGQAPTYLQQAVNTQKGTVQPALNTSKGNLTTAGQDVTAFQGQNPSQMGNMASGLTGQQMASYQAGVQPFLTTQRNQLDTQLRNQGLAPGMPGYDNAMQQIDNSQAMAGYTAAAQFDPQAWQQATQIYMDPVTKAQSAEGLSGANLAQANAGLGLAQSQMGVGSQYGALANAATNTGQTVANIGLQEMSQALPWMAASAPTMPPTPNFPGLNIQPTNLGSLGTNYNSAINQNYQNQLSAYNAQNAQQSNMLSGLFGIGAGALGGLAAGGLFGGV